MKNSNKTTRWRWRWWRWTVGLWDRDWVKVWRPTPHKDGSLWRRCCQSSVSRLVLRDGAWRVCVWNGLIYVCVVCASSTSSLTASVACVSTASDVSVTSVARSVAETSATTRKPRYQTQTQYTVYHSRPTLRSGRSLPRWLSTVKEHTSGYNMRLHTLYKNCRISAVFCGEFSVF